MKTFQIRQNFGQKSYSFLYVSVEETDNLHTKVLEAQQKDYDNRFSSWTGKALEKPTLLVKEYDNDKNKVKKGGLEFKIKWR